MALCRYVFPGMSKEMKYVRGSFWVWDATFCVSYYVMAKNSKDSTPFPFLFDCEYMT